MLRKTFTLIELLVVVAIIAILVGILLPAVTRVRQQAVKLACSSNLRQLGIAVEMYRDQNGNVFPVARYMPSPFISIMNDPTLPQTLNADLGGATRVLICPGDKEYVYSMCQEDSQTSYTYNASLSGRQLDETWFTRRLGFSVTETPVSYDCDGNTFELDAPLKPITVPFFHLLRNLLFADGHVGHYSEKKI